MALRSAVAVLLLTAAAAHSGRPRAEDVDAVSMLQADFQADTSEAEYIRYDLDPEDQPDKEFKVNDPVYMEFIEGPEAGSMMKGNIVGKGNDMGTYNVHLWVGSLRRREKLDVPVGLIHDARPIDAKAAKERREKEQLEAQELMLARKNYETQEQARKERDLAAEKAKQQDLQRKAAEENARKAEDARIKAEEDAIEKKRLQEEARIKAAEEEEAKRKAEALAKQKQEELLAKKKAMRERYEKVKMARKQELVAKTAQLNAATDDQIRAKLWKEAGGMSRRFQKTKLASGPDAAEAYFKKAMKVAKSVREHRIAKAEGKLPPQQEQPTIHVKVKTQSGDKMFDFNLRRRMPLRTFMTVACDRMGLDRDKTRFWRSGQRIQPDDTVGMLGMKNNEVIAVVGPPSMDAKARRMAKLGY